MRDWNIQCCLETRRTTSIGRTMEMRANVDDTATYSANAAKAKARTRAAPERRRMRFINIVIDSLRQRAVTMASTKARQRTCLAHCISATCSSSSTCSCRPTLSPIHSAPSPPSHLLQCVCIATALFASLLSLFGLVHPLEAGLPRPPRQASSRTTQPLASACQCSIITHFHLTAARSSRSQQHQLPPCTPHHQQLHRPASHAASPSSQQPCSHHPPLRTHSQQDLIPCAQRSHRGPPDTAYITRALLPS